MVRWILRPLGQHFEGAVSDHLETMIDPLEAPPVLSTPDTNIFEDRLQPKVEDLNSQRSDEQLRITYEIEQTIAEIRRGRWSRVALQFPDHMLQDASRVSDVLSKGLRDGHPHGVPAKRSSELDMSPSIGDLSISSEQLPVPRVYILADTSYGACCVDEIAAEHVNAEVVVHYGRACLSPTARLPVIHVFTTQHLEINELLQAFKETYPEHQQKIILMADVTYSSHVPRITNALSSKGYTEIYATDIVHDPSSPLPNRTVPEDVRADPAKLKHWQLFHISDPPDSLLLSLSSCVSQIYIYPTPNQITGRADKPVLASTALALRRRYALLTSASTVSVFGILINTLSVKNYLHIVEHVNSQISAAGKKSYTFVVGKVNAAKVANFSEIGAWVVIGCWESSLIESKDFWKPMLTPFELEQALKGDSERVWNGKWISDFQRLLHGPAEPSLAESEHRDGLQHGLVGVGEDNGDGDSDSEPESAPPEFNLRTGRYVSNSRPMRPSVAQRSKLAKRQSQSSTAEMSLMRHAKGDLAVVGGELSPGAEYLRSNRTWKGLGSDFEIAYDEPGISHGAPVEQGRSGIARGYTDGNENSRR